MSFEHTQANEITKYLTKTSNNNNNNIENTREIKAEPEIHRSELKTDHFNMQASVSQNIQHPQLHTSKITIPINNISSSSSTSVTAGTSTSASNLNSRTLATPAINTEEFAKLDALLEDLLAEVEQPILLNKYNENLSQQQQLHQQKQTTEEIERSVDWLNEQKEILRSRKEQLKHAAKKVSDTNITYGNTKYADNESDVPSLNGALNGYMTGINKPPLSPTGRQLYSPQGSQQSQQQDGQSFRSLSTNPTLLRNINETDDEMNMIEAEFDRYSQRSFRSNAGTVQRSKYHTVSNDFVDATRPPAPTPVPSSSYSMKRVSNRKCFIMNTNLMIFFDTLVLGGMSRCHMFIY